MPETDNQGEKWQLIYNRHQDWKKKLKKRGIRPLTIIVTKANIFFQKLRENDLSDFRSEVDVAMQKAVGDTGSDRI